MAPNSVIWLALLPEEAEALELILNTEDEDEELLMLANLRRRLKRAVERG